MNNLPANAGDTGSIPGLGRSPGEENWLPTLVFLSGESTGGTSLECYSPWGLKEWDMTEHTTAAACFLQRNRQTYKWRFRCKLSRLSLWIHFLLFLPDSMPLSPFTFMHWRKKWQPTPVFLPGESQGWQSLVGCCLWGRTESDTTDAT